MRFKHPKYFTRSQCFYGQNHKNDCLGSIGIKILNINKNNIRMYTIVYIYINIYVIYNTYHHIGFNIKQNKIHFLFLPELKL